MGRGSYDLAAAWAHKWHVANRGGASTRAGSWLMSNEYKRRLYMQTLPIAGLCRTRSANSSVTDSAAAATALACGEKTNNGMLGMKPDGSHLKSIAFIAKEKGKSVGLITNDSLYGATPAGFYAHRAHRSMSEEIIGDMAECGFDVLIGNRESKQFVENISARFETNGYHFVDSLKGVADAPADASVLGQISSSIFKTEDSIIADLTMAAIERFEGNTNGFFLMVESCYPDKGGHANEPFVTIMGVIQADWITKKAVEYAMTRDDTLVIVTADHETGGLSAVMSPALDAQAIYTFTTGDHTGEPVPIYAFGAGSAKFGNVLDNTEIPQNIAGFWGAVLPQEK